MAQCLRQHSAAAGTELRLSTGGGAAGNVAFRRDGIQAMVAAAGAAVLLDALAGAGGVGDNAALIPAMAQGVRVVRHEAAAAAIAAVDGLATVFTGGGDHMGLILVGKRGGDILDMAVTAHGAFPDGIAGAGAGGGDRIGLIAVLPLGGGGLLHLPAAGAELQQLAVRLAGRFPDHNALPRMAQGIHVVPLLDLPAARAEVAVIAQGQAGGRSLIQQDEVVVLPAALVAAAVPAAVLLLAAAVGISAAAGALAVRTGLGIPQPDIGHAVLRHAHAIAGVGDGIVDRVLPLLGIGGGGGQGAAVRAAAVTDDGTDAGIRQIGDADGVGLAIRHAVVAGHDHLGGGVVILGETAEVTLLHRGEPAIGGLGQGLLRHAVAVQPGRLRVVRAVAETAVAAALGHGTVVLAVHILIGDRLRQVL